jgi:hypothetical protein
VGKNKSAHGEPQRSTESHREIPYVLVSLLMRYTH